MCGRARYSSFPDPQLLVKSDGDGTKTQLENFLDWVSSRKERSAPIEVGHSLVSTSHLGTLAPKSGQRDKWDPGN